MTISEYAEMKGISYKAAQAQLFRNGERVSRGEYEPCLNCADRIEERRKKAQQLKEQGFPTWAIAKKLHVSRTTVQNDLRG